MSTEELTLVQEFMSEDFFTSDGKKGSFRSSALDLRKQFEEEADEDGARTPLAAWTAERANLQKLLLSLPQLPTSPSSGQSVQSLATGRSPEDIAGVDAFYRELLHHLGYRALAPAAAAVGVTPELYVRSGSAETAPPLLVVFAAPVDDRDDLVAKDDATLLTPTVADAEGTVEHVSVSRLLSARFYGETAAEAPGDSAAPAPVFALVLAGHHILLTEQERWAEGRYIDIDLGLLLDRNDTKRGGAVDQALALISSAAIAPGPDGTTWFSQVLEASVKHTESVSEDLREAVRVSIEIIANEVVDRRRMLGYEPLPADQAQVLARQSLRYLYRILFLLYAEASPELQVVPTGATEYEAGYSLDRLRDLALVDLQAKADGTHIYESLNLLFRLIDTGHNEAPPSAADAATTESESLVFSGLSADLFSSRATSLIDGAEEKHGQREPVGLGNAALQQVLQLLLLSKEKKGTQRGFISYAELGINQLGRVYEGLMSYSGFFAEEPLYEVAKNGDPAKGSWVVPVNRAESIAERDFVTREDPDTHQKKRVRYSAGAFVFRLSGRERQRSASYYTPEVLTRFTVSQALEELLTEETTADEVLGLTLCEPALGSGAFALEGVRQLASEYLRRKQEELGTTIDPADYGRELQKAKAYIALHNVYGVDLNSTAVELAEISLWLDTMVAGLSAPWFGLRLRRGNSLIGARRSVYSRDQVKDNQHLKTTPVRVAAEDHTSGIRSRRSDEVYQFLLPSDGWGATADSKEGRLLAPERVKELKDWRKGVRRKLTAARDTVTNREKFKQLERLQALSTQVDALWKTAERRLQIAEQESQRSIAVWGQPTPSAGSTVTRDQIEEKLSDPNGAYRRLRRVMDAWCALWFWPLTVDDTVMDPMTGEETRITPPTVEEWIDALEQLLGHPTRTREDSGAEGRFRQLDLIADASWDELNELEENQLLFASAKRVDTVMTSNPWLSVVESLASEQAFFHWDLEFPTVFADGGFDLQVGNPPWVRPDYVAADLLAESDPWWQLEGKPSESLRQSKRTEALSSAETKRSLLESENEIVAQSNYLSHESTFSLISGTRPDLYRCFIQRASENSSSTGVSGLIHYDTHLADDRAVRLRRHVYGSLRRHWHFINELMLFDIEDHKTFSVNIYGGFVGPASFLHAVYLYHPSTVERSLLHDGSGPEPGIKDEFGKWDTRAHSSRIQQVDAEVLKTWAAAIEPDGTPFAESKMVYTVSRASASVLGKLASADRLSSLNPYFSSGWNETIDHQRGRFEKQWGSPGSWRRAIIQGPNIHVGNPFFKQPNSTMRHNQDWSSVDLEALPHDAVPVTTYKPIESVEYDGSYTRWSMGGAQLPARDFYRLSWRTMAAHTGERTFIPALTPPGVTHVHAVSSLGFPGGSRMVAVASSFAGSLLGDFFVRASRSSTITSSIVGRLPIAHRLGATRMAMLRTLRLNSMVEGYSSLWGECFEPEYTNDSWVAGYGFDQSSLLGNIGPIWGAETPLRIAADRRQAFLEIDVLVAIMVGVTIDELCTVYRTQFPVLYGYDTGLDRKTQYWYDQNGRLVPLTVRKAWLAAQDKGVDADPDDLRATNDAGNEYTYVPPFTLLDREADMRAAYAEFERRLAEQE